MIKSVTSHTYPSANISQLYPTTINLPFYAKYSWFPSHPCTTRIYLFTLEEIIKKIIITLEGQATRKLIHIYLCSALGPSHNHSMNHEQAIPHCMGTMVFLYDNVTILKQGILKTKTNTKSQKRLIMLKLATYFHKFKQQTYYTLKFTIPTTTDISHPITRIGNKHPIFMHSKLQPPIHEQTNSQKFKICYFFAYQLRKRKKL